MNTYRHKTNNKFIIYIIYIFLRRLFEKQYYFPSIGII